MKLKLNSMKNQFYLLFIISLFFYDVSNANQDNKFISANEQYNLENYNTAVFKYKEILDSGFHSPELYFNLGSAYYKLDSIAQSIYFYEKGLIHFPRNEDLKQNLQFVNNLIIDDIDDISRNLIENRIIEVFNYIELNTWSYISIVFSLISSLIFIIYYFLNSVRFKKFYFTLFCVMFLLTISNLTINFYISNFENNSLSAIIFSKEVEIKLEPNKRSDTLFNLHEGTKVQIIENFDDQWVKIMLSDGQIGWIIKNQIKIL